MQDANVFIEGIRPEIVPSGDRNGSSDVELSDFCEIQNMGPPTQPMEGHTVEGWVPSRGRGLPSTLYMAASGAKPSGGALPSLPPSPILTMQDRDNFSTILNPIRGLFVKDIPKSSRNVWKELCDSPSAVIEMMLSALK